MSFEEMCPKWFTHSEIPYRNMWPDHELWYPMMFNNQYFDGSFKYEGCSKLLEHSITEN